MDLCSKSVFISFPPFLSGSSNLVNLGVMQRCGNCQSSLEYGHGQYYQQAVLYTAPKGSILLIPQQVGRCFNRCSGHHDVAAFHLSTLYYTAHNDGFHLFSP